MQKQIEKNLSQISSCCLYKNLKLVVTSNLPLLLRVSIRLVSSRIVVHFVTSRYDTLGYVALSLV